jgi:hypothetical protein
MDKMAQKKVKRIKTFKKSKAFGFIKKLGGFFLRRAKVIQHDETLPEQAIYLTTHGIKPLLGIMKNEISMPREVEFATIGTHELCNPYFKRLMWGCNVHYRMRNGWGRVRAFFASAIVCIFLGQLYKMARIIPSFRDMRSRRTMSESFRALDKGYSILLYPENLDHLYNNIMVEFLPGFVVIAKLYYERTGKEIPIVPCYFSYQFNKLVIGKPISAIQMLNEGKTKEEVAEFFRVKVMELYDQDIKPLAQAIEAKYMKFNKA